MCQFFVPLKLNAEHYYNSLHHDSKVKLSNACDVFVHHKRSIARFCFSFWHGGAYISIAIFKGAAQ